MVNIKLLLKVVVVVVVLNLFSSDVNSARFQPKIRLVDNTKDADLNFADLAAKYDYPAEQYNVTTDDGYSLPLYRIAHGPYDTPSMLKKRKRPAVLLQHCILCSPNFFLLSGPKRALAFMLADAGYDVWLGAFRGSENANTHAYRQTRSKIYYDFSWDEMGLYDYPAFINKALEVTGEPKLAVIGHSMGTTAFYVMSTMKREYTKAKVSFMVSLSPVSFMKHIKSPLFRLLYGPIATTMKSSGITHVDGRYIRMLGKSLSLNKFFLRSVFPLVYFEISGYDWKELDLELLPSLIGSLPSGSSTRSLLHYGQLMRTGKFTRYDYGPEENMVKYKQESPPDYKLFLNAVPMLLCYSDNDWLSQKQDFEKLYNGLLQGAGRIELYKVPHKNFNHMDFLFAKNAPTLLYHYVIDRLNKELKTNSKKKN